MKRLWCSVGILLTMILFCCISTLRVNQICKDTSNILRQAETQCLLGNFHAAEDTVYLSERYWRKHEGFLGIALRHTETDDIDLMFPALTQAAHQKDGEEFLLRNTELIAAFRSLSRMELPYYFNIL